MSNDTIKNLNPFQLAREADCSSPDSAGSPGADFLARVKSGVLDALDYGVEYVEDSAAEVADGSIPVYTHQMWLTFVDLCGYQEDVSEFGPVDEPNDVATRALYIIAERLAMNLLTNAMAEDDDE